MSEVFDPYYKWLGIPPEEQPPHHYRLLGIRLFEADADVIESAADARMTHLRSMQGGERGEHSQRLLNEVAGARLCLLDPDRKAPYDQQLKAARARPTRIAATNAPRPVAAVATPVSPVAPAPAAPPSTGPVAAAEAEVPVATPRRTVRRRRRKQSPISDPIVWTIIATLLIALLGGVALVVSGLRDDKEKSNKTTANNTGVKQPKVKKPLVRIRPPTKDPDHDKTGGSDRTGTGKTGGSNKTGTGKTGSGKTGSGKAGGMVITGPAREPIAEGDWLILQPERLSVVDEATLKRYDDGSMLIEHSQARETYEFSTTTKLAAIRRLRIESVPLEDDTPSAVGDKTLVVEELELKAAPAADEALEPAPQALTPILSTADSGDSAAKTNAAAMAIDGDASTGWAAPLNEHHIAEFALRDVIEDERGTRLVLRLHVNSGEGAEGVVRRRLRIAVSDKLPDSAEAAPSDPSGSPSEIVRAAPPGSETQSKIRQQLEKLHPADESPTPDSLLKRYHQFHELADKSKDAEERFVLLRASTEAAQGAGDARLLFQTLDEIESRYDFDAGIAARIQFLKQLAEKARTRDAIDSLVAASMEAVREAIAADQYQAASELVDVNYETSQQPTGRRYRKMLFDTQKAVKSLVDQRNFYASAQETLKTTPDDMEALLTAGRWLCFQRGDWEAGLKALSNSADTDLRALAEADLKAAPPAALAMGDRWWEAAKAAEPAEREGMQRRAAHWYRRVDSKSLSELVRARVQKRLEEADAIQPVGEQLLAPMRQLPIGVWCNLLSRVEPKQDTVAGEWRRRREAVKVETPADRARINMPLAIDGSYLLDVDFTCVEGRDAMIAIPVGDRSARIVLATGPNRLSGLTEIDGNNPGKNGTKAPLRVKPLQRHRVSIGVQLNDGGATIQAEFDGKPYIHWSGPLSSLGPGASWRPSRRDAVSLLAAFKANVTYHAVYFQLRSGKATFLRPDYRFAKPPSPAPSSAPK